MFEFKEDLEIIIEVHGFTPSRPAPLCDNPSDFNFADPGDDASWQDVKFYYLVDNNPLKPPAALTAWGLLSTVSHLFATLRTLASAPSRVGLSWTINFGVLSASPHTFSILLVI